MSFNWTLTTSRLSPNISSFATFLSQSLDSIITRLLAWTRTPNPLLRKAVMKKITDYTESTLRAFAADGETILESYKFILRQATEDGVDVYEETTIYPQDYSIDVSVKVEESAPNTVMTITYDEYDADDVLQYTDTFVHTIYTSPAYPDEFEVAIQDSEWVGEKVTGVFA